MLRKLLEGLRDESRDGLPLPIVERGEFADPSDIPAGQSGSRGSLNSIDPEAEKERNRHYKAALKIHTDAVREKIEENQSPRNEIRNFEILGLLGSGSYGEVFKAKTIGNDRIYALKVQAKRDILRTKRGITSVMREKKFMNALDFEFLLKLRFAFKDARNLYLVSDYAYFGDVSKILKYKLSEISVKFMIAQCILGIEYLHACNIAHRDIKPANLLIFEDGYIKIGDFGLSKQFKERTHTCVGTVTYMAPEVLEQRGYRKGVDWWSMGILLYRMIYYKHPFAELKHNRFQTLERIKDTDLSFPKVVYPDSAVNGFISGLLEKKASKRLGMLKNGSDDIKQHEWFSDICFSEIISKTTKILPWRPEMECKPYPKILFLPAEGEADFKPGLFKEF